MATQRKLQLVIEVATKQQQKISELINQLESLNKAAKSSGQVGADTKSIDQLIGKLRAAEKELGGLPEQAKKFNDELQKGGKPTAAAITAIATSFLAVQSAIQTAFGLAQTFYQKTIGLSERLNQQLLKNAANIAATSQVEIGGNLVEGVDAIKQLQPELRAALQELEKRTENIAGVTDQQTVTAFDAVIGKVGLLNGQTERFSNSIEGATELAASLTAALSANNLSDTTQIYQEIGDLLTGDITADSQLARALAIDRETIQRWQQQGVLVDSLIDRLGGFEDAANLASNSISNVSSNFISLTERIARESTADLLDPIANGLLEVFNLVSDNEDEIVAEIKVVLDALGGIATELGAILSPLGDLGDEAEVILGVLLDGFQGLERVLQLFGPQVTAVLAGAVNKIEILVGAVEKLGIAFNFVTGGLRNVDEALEAYGSASDIAAAGSQKLIDSIENAGSKSEATQKLLKKQADAQIEANNAQIESLRELVPVSRKQREEVSAQIEALEGWNEKLDESKDTLQGVGDELNILARELPDVADTFEEVSARTDNALQKLADGSDGSLEKVSQNLKQVQEGINQLFESGELSGEDAISRLNQAIEAPGLELSQRLALAQEVRKIQKTASDERLAQIDVELKESQAGLTESEKATAENVQRVAALQEKALQARIQQTRDAIAQEQALISRGAGSERTLRELQRSQRTLGAELKDLAVTQQREIEQARLDEIDRAQLDIQKIILDSRRTINQEEQLLIAELAQNAELTEGQVQARLARLRAQSNVERLNAEIALQQQRVEVFEEGSRKRREAELKLGDLRQSLIEAVAQKELAIQNEAVAAIDVQIQDEQRLQELQKSRLQLREQAEDRVLDSLNQQKDIFESQLGLIKERNSLVQSLAGAETEDAERALAIRRQLDSNEDLSRAERKQLEKDLQNLGFRRGASEKKIAEEILKRKQAEIELRAQSLQSEQTAQRAQLQFQNQLRTLEADRETRREQGRLRELQFQRDLLELEAAKADARGDARGAEIAREGIDRTDESIRDQQQAIRQAQASEVVVEQLNQNALQELSARQARESFEFARSVAQESQQLATELGQINEQVGRRARRFASQQNDAADGARVEAERALNGLQGVRADKAAEELSLAQDKAETNIELINASKDLASISEGQLVIERQLADEAERRLAAVNSLKEALGDPASQAQTAPIPSLDTGGPLPSGQTAMIHAGELLVPGAPTRSAAVNAIATGRTIQSVQSDGLYRGPGGYVLNRGDVQQLVGSSEGTLLQSPPTMGAGLPGGPSLDASELIQQTGLLGDLVELARNAQSGRKAAARVARHGRYKK